MPMPDEPEVPIQAEHVWNLFWWLHRRRQPNMGSVPAPLAVSEVLATHILTGRSVDPDEVEMVFEMDDILISTWAELEHKQREHDKQASGAIKRSKVSPKQGGSDQ